MYCNRYVPTTTNLEHKHCQLSLEIDDKNDNQDHVHKKSKNVNNDAKAADERKWTGLNKCDQ